MSFVYSLFDYSGNWPTPYLQYGYQIICIDPKHKDNHHKDTEDIIFCSSTVKDFRVLIENEGPLTPSCDVLLMAPPCTNFAVSGSRWWAQKDIDGRTAQSIAIIKDCLALIELLRPKVWALENPVGRLKKLVPELGEPAFTFDPYEYAALADLPIIEAYKKRTCIWGNCVKPPTKPYGPILAGRGDHKGSWLHTQLGSKNEKTKELRSNTPIGFARAFAQANRKDSPQ